jgi:hypothetical protein
MYSYFISHLKYTIPYIQYNSLMYIKLWVKEIKVKNNFKTSVDQNK